MTNDLCLWVFSEHYSRIIALLSVRIQSCADPRLFWCHAFPHCRHYAMPFYGPAHIDISKHFPMHTKTSLTFLAALCVCMSHYTVDPRYTYLRWTRRTLVYLWPDSRTQPTKCNAFERRPVLCDRKHCRHTGWCGVGAQIPARHLLAKIHYVRCGWLDWTGNARFTRLAHGKRNCGCAFGNNCLHTTHTHILMGMCLHYCSVPRVILNPDDCEYITTSRPEREIMTNTCWHGSERIDSTESAGHTAEWHIPSFTVKTL